MPSPPSGPVPLLIICGVALLTIAVGLAVCARPSNHERSIHHREKGWRE